MDKYSLILKAEDLLLFSVGQKTKQFIDIPLDSGEVAVTFSK